MLKFIRNDDVAADTTLHEIKTFCEICDRYGVTPIHAITPIGNCRPVDVAMDNATIRRVSGTALFSENREVAEYLRGRKSDEFAVHGLWHTHGQSFDEIAAAQYLLSKFNPRWFVPPFNEWWEDANQLVVWGDRNKPLKICGGVPRLEGFLDSGDPGAEITYLHSWRFETGWGDYSWEQLDRCLKRLTSR